MKKIILFSLLIGLIQSTHAQVLPSSNQQTVRNPLPSPYQLRWHENSYYLFMHFGPNTFTNKEWGDGKESTAIFNPSQMDCEQWCRIAKAAGAKGIIITAKHHDGFCLWPSKYSTHTVAQSIFKRDVLAELSAACKKNGLLFGVYISPWDRNHPDYGTEQYNTVFVNMLKEIFQNYGPIWELWWDGANGEGPNGKKQIYDWERFETTVRNLSPQTVIFSDIGPDIRWIGNENGKASTTNWNLLDTIGFKRGLGAPPNDTLQQGNYRGANYIPAEADVSIRPGWFYHQTENSQVKSADELMNIYLNSVGRGANLLLNVPPDDRGLISAYDSSALTNFFKKRSIFDGPNLLKNASISIGEPDRNNIKKPYSWYYVLKKPVLMNGLILEEDLKYGQKIASLNITISNSGETKLQQKITTVGNKRIILFPQPIDASEVAIVVLESKGMPVFKTLKAF
ncbi:MAG: alpha-L-fucosidase [Sphingobacteriia bacterium]|jgi:alpha-L-fucosidase